MSKGKLKIKVGSTFSDLLNILFGVPQGSIFGSYPDVATPFFYG